MLCDLMGIPELEFKDFIAKRASSKQDMNSLLDSVKKVNKNDTVVQIFNSKRIASRTHLIGAYANALIAFKNQTNKTKSTAMEMLLFAAMTDQIGDAIEIVGAKNPSDFVIFANKKDVLNKLNKQILLGSDFKPSAAALKNAAKAAGIKVEKKKVTEIEALILQKMAISRLGSN
jgi:tRNA threonylcarbamoyladenosine modification (KEOPS) complex Cgi121 subunit